MLLSTLDRVKRMANKSGTQDDLDLSDCLSSASSMIQQIMSRPVEVKSRAESVWPTSSGIIFLKAWPVRSIASVEVSDGRGGYVAIPSSSYWLADGNELHIGTAIPFRRDLRITYTGGLAYSPDVSLYNVTGVTGTPTSNFTTSAGATGKVVAYSAGAGTASIQCLSGSFREGDTMTNVGGTAWSLTLAAVVQESVISDCADLARACDMQAVYMHQRRNSLGRTSTTNGGTTTFVDGYEILKGVKQIVDLYDPQL